ncbi:putative membrane protein [Neofusicoccum parvum]|nr:putative membrane protein [Neofusicoccum parvum]
MSWLASFTQERDMDLIKRGSHNPTPIGSAVFVGLRALDPLLQYGILAHGVGSTILTTLGLSVRAPGLPAQTGIQALDALALSPPRLLLLAMATGAALKQIHWRLFISQEEMPAGAALEIAFFNTVNNGVATLAFTTALLSPSAGDPAEAALSPPALVGAALFAAGLALEWGSELQRVRWKKDPANAGRPYTGGLWRLARHVNYGGYVLWRAGVAMSGAGWAVGAAFGLLFMWDFATRGVPVMDRYCSGRYGEDWKRFKEQTPYKLLPFVY